MKCQMLHPADGAWKRYGSLKSARDQFCSDAATAVNCYGQSEHLWCEAWVVRGHENGDGDKYPDWTLHYNPDLDTVRTEKT